MTAATFFEQQHGTKTEFLSKDEVIRFAERFAEQRHNEFQKAKESFNTERWMNEELLRKKFPKKD
jgi:cobalamin-dependent methionine synthase I